MEEYPYMNQMIVKLGLLVLVLVAIGFFYKEGNIHIFGTCPAGQTMVGQAQKGCLKIPLGAESEVRQLYRIAEIKSGQTTEQYASIVFDQPMKVDEVLQLLSSFQFHCTSVYFYDFDSRMYNSREIANDCGLLRPTVAEVVASDNSGSKSLRSPVVLSVTGKGLPSQLLHFWQTHSDQVRAVSISLSPDVLPPQFKAFPQIEE